MEDAADLKSASLTGVGVRIPSWAPLQFLRLSHAVLGGFRFVAARRRIGTPPRLKILPLSHVKCGNICGNTS